MASLGARSMYIGAGVRRVARIGAKLHENGRLAAGNPAASVLLRRWQRTARFSSQSAAVDGHVEAMVAILGEDAVVIDPEEMAPYNVDWLKNHRGKSKMVLLPASTQQLSRVLAYCSQHDIKVVPQGGNTGLVGGSVPMNDEVIINMKRMNKIRSLDESRQASNNSSTVGSAVVGKPTTDLALNYARQRRAGVRGRLHFGALARLVGGSRV